MKLFQVALAAVVCVGLLFSASEAKGKAAMAKSTTIMGSVVSVDAVANTIVVMVKKANDTISVDTAAMIMSGKNKVTLSDLKTDAKVKISCKMVDGKKVATKISEMAAKPAKAAKAEKAAK